MASVTPVLFPVLKQSQGDGSETLYFPVFSLNWMEIRSIQRIQAICKSLKHELGSI